jgi:hypothetical protein
MKRRTITAVLATISIMAMMQTAKASLLTLGDLLSGGTISTPDNEKTFSNFGLVSANPSLYSQAAALNVSAYMIGDVGYLEWSGPIDLDNTSGSSVIHGDIKLSYTVTVNGPKLIDAIDQNYTGNALPGWGNIAIGETVSKPNLQIVGQSYLTLKPNDPSDPLAEDGDVLNFAPVSQLLVVKDIYLTANAGFDVPLSDIRQSFHEVPEPTTMIAGALLLLPFGASTIRIVRRNRAA